MPLFYFFVMLLCVTCDALNVAVIGGGIGGSAVTRFLREAYIKEDVEITLFERKQEVGGRLDTVEVENAPEFKSEIGASVYHALNKNLVGWVAEFGLKTTKPYEGGAMGIWNGEEFLIHTSSNSWISLAQLLWRWGWSLRTLDTLDTKIIGTFMKMYTVLHTHGLGFESVNELLTSVGLYNHTQITLGESLRAAGVSEKLIDELITGAIRVNYAQAPDALNAFAGYVGLKGSGDKLFSVKGGNKQLCKLLLESSGTTVELEHTVTKIQYDDFVGKYEIHYKKGNLNDVQVYPQYFDYVVIATPFQYSAITLPETVSDKTIKAITQLDYVTLHVTFVIACLNSTYFGTDDTPTTIMTTENPKIPFTSIGKLPHPTSPCPSYKIFSRERMEDETLDELFTSVSWVSRHVWKAYPKLTPIKQHAPVTLMPGLYYLNGLEFAVSTMETETLAAKNIANLIAHSIRRAAPAANPKGRDADARHETTDEL